MKTLAAHPNLFVLDHPLIQHKLSMMRDKDCPRTLFRGLLREIALLMGYELTKDLVLTTRAVETPITTMDAPVLAGREPVIVPILRAGLGMAEGLQELIPTAPVGHIGLYRDHDTKQPVEYLVRVPPHEGRQVIMVDPMLATGHSAVHAVRVMVGQGVAPADIRFMALVAAPEGVKVFHDAWPMVPVYTAALDSHLNENAYIVPGLGDAGDRIFGTR